MPHPHTYAPSKTSKKPTHHDSCEHHGGCSHDHSHHDHGHHGHDHGHCEGENHWLKAGLGLVFGIGLLALSLTGIHLPLIAHAIIVGASTLATLYLGKNVYLSAWNALLKRKWDTTTLYSISTLAITIVSILSTFIPGLNMMAEAAPLVLGFWHLGEGIEHSLIDEINQKLDVRDCIPPLAQLEGAFPIEILVEQLEPNDVISVPANSVIPVDGILMRKAELYTTRLDGSPMLKEYEKGALVRSGMVLAGGQSSVPITVTKKYKDSYLSIVANNIKNAHNEKAPIELFANKILKYFIPGLLAIALIAGVFIGIFFTPALAVQCVVSVLVSACPCAFSLITPMAVQIAMKKASENGIHFNNGKAMQAASDIDTVVFDLNGTLTKGNISVKSLKITDTKFLQHVANLEGFSQHPSAKTISKYINSKKPRFGDELIITALDRSHHSGMKAIINGEVFMIGNMQMLAANGITHIDSPFNNPEEGEVYIVRGAKVIGQIALEDPLRQDARATITQLKKQGIAVHICTGADKQTALRYAKDLDIPEENVCANTVGAATQHDEVSKTSYIEALKNKGLKVAMVGDAANDVTAIASAHLGIAVKSSIGDKITQKEADIVIQKGLLFPIATAFDVAKKAKNNIIQNLGLSLTYNSVITLIAAGLFVAVGFALNPALGVALMVLESTVILANLLRFKQQSIVTAPKSDKITADHKPEESTTTKILHALGLRNQPSHTALNDIEPTHQCVNKISGGIFSHPTPCLSKQYKTPPSGMVVAGLR